MRFKHICIDQRKISLDNFQTLVSKNSLKGVRIMGTLKEIHREGVAKTVNQM